ncbi:hypothetical protein OG194_29745 [Streptomyces sp. NBC_01288]|uniref:hypothetical protein n=1 Tax=Streptomyces sp. NBC_01288 TaxID=2903814 RepID=UPI002E0E4058|nr:hypothetical protein OG194_29745 [Streptomyces sp. NBC_01288]
MICTLCTTHDLKYGVLCASCTLALQDRLARLPRMWASLEAWLAPGSTGTAQYGGRVRRAEAPLPLNQEVLDLRAAGGIAGVLEDWRDAVHDTRGLPTAPRTGALARRVSTAAADLIASLYFIALWDQGVQLGREVEQLVGRVRAVAEPGRDPDEPTFLGYCIAIDLSGVVCGSRLYADMAQTVQCQWCLCLYPPDRWLQLRLLQPGNTPAKEDQDVEEPRISKVAEGTAERLERAWTSGRSGGRWSRCTTAAAGSTSTEVWVGCRSHTARALEGAGERE